MQRQKEDSAERQVLTRWVAVESSLEATLMKSLAPLLSLLSEIPDHRRGQGRLYRLPHLLLFAILAIVSGANSYRGICTFIKIHRAKLNKAFKTGWKRAPAYTAIRYILQGLEPEAIEKAFREHAAGLNLAATASGTRIVALDGKALKGSFDAFNDLKAREVLSAFAADTALVLAHIEIDEKSNEIPAVQKLLGELGIAGCIVTCDAMHCQKNLRGRQSRERPSHRSTQGQSAALAASG